VAALAQFLSLYIYCDELPGCLVSMALDYNQRHSIRALPGPSQMKNIYKLSIVTVAQCRKHAFDVSLRMGRARQEEIVT
jgi:hypothetical protein